MKLQKFVLKFQKLLVFGQFQAREKLERRWEWENDLNRILKQHQRVR
jgi:hypothetical protein